MERRGDPQRFCASRCRDSISALVSACSPSRRDFIRLALAGSSLPFMPSLGLGSGLANDRTRFRINPERRKLPLSRATELPGLDAFSDGNVERCFRDAEGGESSQEPSHFAESALLTPCRMWGTFTT